MNNELDFFSKEPFVEIVERICSIRNSNIKVDNLQVFFKYRKDIPGTIEGVILGDELKANELIELRWNHYKNQKDKLILESIPNNSLSTFFSNDFRIPMIRKENSKSYIIAKLDFKTLEKTILPKREDDLFPTIKFYFPFYNELWINLTNYEDETDNISEKAREDTFINFEDFKIRILEEFVYDNDINDNSVIKKLLYCFEFSNRDNLNIPLAEFIENANSTVRKFILLTSFLCGNKYDWFFSFGISSEKYKYTFKAFENNSIRRISYDRLLINPSDFLIFIEKAISNYNEALNDNIDLYTSLIYYLTHDKPIFIEQKFIVLYIALENICNLLSDKMKLAENVDGNIFKKLYSRVKAVVDEFDLNEVSKGNIIKKISELKRSPMKFRFENIFEKYDIDISDCYYDEKKEVIKFLSIRNKLMHTSYTGDSITIKEYYRMRKYYELLLLKLLGWEKGIADTYYLYESYNLNK